MIEHHLAVQRTARYYTLGVAKPNTRQIWYVCHGYGVLAAEFLAEFAGLDDGSRVVVAPEGLSRFYTDHKAGRVGASWMTRSDRNREIADYVAYLDRVHEQVLAGLDDSKMTIHILGFSQGAHTAVRWLVNGSIQPHRLVLWGGLLPPDIDMQAFRDRLGKTDLLIVRGERDPLVKPSALAQQESDLSAQGIGIRILAFKGAHRIDAKTLERIASNVSPL